MLGQTFELRDLAVMALLVLLEGLLSVDNALVLGVLVQRVPPALRARALHYGLAGALVFRLVAVLAASMLLRWRTIKLLGGLYLIYITGSYFNSRRKTATGKGQSQATGPDGDASAMPITAPGSKTHFWRTVWLIEGTDVAFAMDSILAAVALVGPPPPGRSVGSPHPKLWVVYFGGMIGVALMRFAAYAVVHFLDRWPRLITSAYLMVALIGLKLLWEWRFGPDAAHSLVIWVLWGAMAAALAVAFVPAKRRDVPAGG
jgi:YkoY family integral membrane protein